MRKDRSLLRQWGIAQAINFQPTGGGKAAITGDFVLIASEVNPVIKALRDNGVEVTTLHVDGRIRVYASCTSGPMMH